MSELTKEEIAHKILYSPVTNGQHVSSLDDGAKLIQAYADQQAASMHSEDEWIRVEDKTKPADGQWVHVASKTLDGKFDIHLTACRYSKKYNDFTGYGEAQHDGRVTHWQPLPTPPTT